MTAIIHSRTEVAVGGIQQTPISGKYIVQPGFAVQVMVENMTTTDDIINDTDDAYPVLVGQLPVCGNLINAMVYAPLSGLELYLHEMMQDTTHLSPGIWRLADQSLVTPGLPAFVRAFRFVAHRARIMVYNSAAYPITTDVMVRVSTT